MIGKKVKSINTIDQQWQAESDARTLATYQEILADKNRMNRAVKEAKKQVANLTKRAALMKKAAIKKK